MRTRPILAALLVLAAAPVAAEQRLRLDQTDPDHRRGLARPVIVPPMGGAPRTQFIRPRMIYALPDGVTAVARIDSRLSDRCRRGAFVQYMDGLFWAQTKDRSYGVAFPSGGSLIDPQKLGRDGEVYFFHVQDSRCTVYVGDRQRLMPNYVQG